MLGIDNEHLLHEIHNSEDYIFQQATYSQIQQNAENLDMAGEGLQSSPTQNSNGSPSGSPVQYRVNNYVGKSGGYGHVNSDLVKGLGNTDLSPYNSKFTVLRFSQPKSNSSQGKMKAPSLRPFELSPDTDCVMQS